ncbi:hypothetical protein Goshw_020444 [Gossypium schwendimanii]|uniref:Uncharacterized protein n=1 Tax=Gossypium schwendimanii TaxID=34291 RepID=A0A7J9N234_GOSSC|nr:hypothetical protein [Gossypium schwendimanii]
MMMMVMMVGGKNQFIVQKEGRGSLGSNGMNNDGVGIGREGEIVLKKRPWTAAKDVVLSDMGGLMVKGSGMMCKRTLLNQKPLLSTNKSLGSNWMNNCGVGIEREGGIRLKKGSWNVYMLYAWL